MCIQSIQRRKALCKLISATFLMNSVGLPTTFAAEAVDTSVSNTDIKDENGLPTIKGNNEDRKYPSWYFHADGTPLTEAELKSRNYKESYSSVEIARIYELLNTYGLAKVQQMQFNVSFRQNSDGSTTIDVNDKANNNPTKGVEFGKGKDGSTVKPGDTPSNKPETKTPDKQLNPTTDGSGTAPTDTKTNPTCDANSELVGGVCMLKCAAGSTRSLADKLCHVTSCPADSIFNEDKTACTACPTGEIPDASQTKCVKKTVDCGENEIYADNDKTSCKACPVGTKPNAAQTSCEDVTCGENEIYADENKRTCKACPTDTVPNADQTECVEKTAPAKPAITLTVTCDAEEGEYKGADGTCQTCPTGQKLNEDEDGCVAVPATTECSDTQEKWKDACVDKCKEGETRNQETGVCAAAVTPNKAPAAPVETPPSGGSGGGGSKSGIGKALAGVAGLAALASLFGHGGSGGSGDDHPNANADNGKGVTRIYEVNENEVKFDIRNPKTNEHEEYIGKETPYDAIIKFGSLKTGNYGTPTKGDVSILGTKYINVPFTSGEQFHLIGEGGLAPGTYKVLINIHFPATGTDSNGHVQTIKTNLRVLDSVLGITDDDGTKKAVVGGNVTLETDAEVAAEANMALYKASIVSAVWNGDEENGFCMLKVNGGTLVNDTMNGNAGELTVASKHLTKEECESPEILKKEATFTKLSMNSTVNSTDGVLLDGGETVIDDHGYYRGQDTYDALRERMKDSLTYDPNFQIIVGNQDGGDEGSGVPMTMELEEDGYYHFKTYSANTPNEEQNGICAKTFDVDSCEYVKLDKDGTLLYDNGNGDVHKVTKYGGKIENFVGQAVDNIEFDTHGDGAVKSVGKRVAETISSGVTYMKDTLNEFAGTAAKMAGYKSNQSPVQSVATKAAKTLYEISGNSSGGAMSKGNQETTTPDNGNNSQDGAQPAPQTDSQGQTTM